MFEDIIKKTVVRDINGVEIKPGNLVLIHQMQETRKAVVVEVTTDSPTLCEPGFWVDVNDGCGVEGIMSYVMEVKQVKI